MNYRQGSITALLNQAGKVSEPYSYDAWGRRRNPANWIDYNVKAPRLISPGYTGHEMLDGFGLINMNGRMYDPVIGRVLSPDPFVQSPGFTQSYNRYSYCMNNPLRYTDPSGYTYKPDDWNQAPVYSGYYTFGDGGGGGGIGPGSGNFWADQYRTEYGNYMLGSESSFNKMYGPGAYDIVQFFTSDPALQNQWRQGTISIEKIRENGGYYIPVASQSNTTAPTWIDTPQGKAILLSGTTTAMKWVTVGGSSPIIQVSTNVQLSPIDIGFKINGAADIAGTLTTANIYGAQKLAGIAARDMAKLSALRLIGHVTGVISAFDNAREFYSDPRGNWLNGVEAVGQISFMLFGGEETELIYNLSTMAIDLTIDAVNTHNKNRR